MSSGEEGDAEGGEGVGGREDDREEGGGEFGEVEAEAEMGEADRGGGRRGVVGVRREEHDPVERASGGLSGLGDRLTLDGRSGD